VGRVVAPSDWCSFRKQLRKVAKVDLPESVPQYEGENTCVPVLTPRGHLARCPLAELETLLGPVLFLLPNRDGAIVPIRRKFVEQLFNTSLQGSLLPRAEAGLFSERVYYSHLTTLGVLKVGMPILFYESKTDKGRGVVFACARIVRVESREPGEVTKDLERRGVLNASTMRRMRYSGQVAITFFDNIMRLKNPVPLQTLRDMHCVDAANLVKARLLRADQLQAVLTAGQVNG
jgi:hypothetical protein